MRAWVEGMVHRHAQCKIRCLATGPRSFGRMSTKPRPVFHRRIFWDVDFDKLDYEVDAVLVIEHVFSWGDIPDVREARKYYGDERILAVLLDSDNIPIVPLHLWSAVFKRPLSEFKGHRKDKGLDPYLVKRAYFDRLHEIHGLPPLPPPDPILMRMS